MWNHKNQGTKPHNDGTNGYPDRNMSPAAQITDEYHSNDVPDLIAGRYQTRQTGRYLETFFDRRYNGIYIT